MRTAVVRLLVVAVFTMLSLSVSAAPIGTLAISGSFSVGPTTIDFFPPSGGVFGFFNVEPASSGDFAALVDPADSEDGEMLDLDVAIQPVGPPGFLLPGFMTFQLNPSIIFDLTFIEPGVFSSATCGGAPAGGQTCTPGFPPPNGSPFNLTNNTSETSTATFTVRGNVRDTSDLTTVPFIGIFTSQFTGPNQSFQDLLAILGAGGSVDNSFSASFTTTVIPEPGTMSIMLIGVGLIGLAGVRRRYRKQ